MGMLSMIRESGQFSFRLIFPERALFGRIDYLFKKTGFNFICTNQENWDYEL